MRCALLALMLTGVLAAAGDAQAATCSFTGVGGTGIWHLGSNWSCGHIPTTGDTAIVDSGDNVTVDQDDSVPTLTHNEGTIAFSGSATLQTTTAATLNAGTITGPGTLRAATGTFAKATSGVVSVTNQARLALDVPGSIDGGSICLMDLGPGDPQLQINAALTIGAGAAGNVFPCNAGISAPVIKVNPGGSLIKATAGQKDVGTPLDDDGLIDVQAGTLQLLGDDGATTAGGFQIAAGAALHLNAAFGLTAAASITGAGALTVVGGNVGLAAGAAFSPATLTMQGGQLTLGGTTPAYAPATLNLDGGTLAGSRDVTPGALNATGGGLSGNFTTTVGVGATFTKTTGGSLSVLNQAKLVLDVPASIDGGGICLMDSGPGDPQVRLNAALTIGAGAAAAPFPCNAGINTAAIKINPGGSLARASAGTSAISARVGVDGGTLSAASGQALSLSQGFAQTAGTIAVAAGGGLDTSDASTVSGGTLQVDGAYSGATTLTGTGVLTGAGTVTGAVTNTSGTVRPGSSPGTLTISGGFTQGAAGTLEVDVAGTTPGTQFDVLAVSGHAALDGTVAVQGGFDPLLTDTFQFLTSGSRGGTFASVTSAPLPGGKAYGLDYPPGAPLGARLVLQPPLQPQNTSPPSVTGTPAAGQTVTCDPGTWANGPSLTFEWLRDGQPVAGATAATLLLGAADAGHQVACRVTGTNAAGNAQATSAAVTVPALPAADAPPANTTPPAVGGEGRAGATLTCTTGAWTGTPAPALTIAWLRDGQPIAGAAAATYVLTGADGGHAVACRVTATNRAGTATATSGAKAVARPAEQVLATKTKDQVATALGLPSAKPCVSRRNFPIHVRKPAGVTIRAVRILVNGRRVTVRKVAGRFTATVDLRGLPKGSFTVAITVTTPSGRRIAGARRYRTCAPKRR